MLVNATEMLIKARDGHYGVPQFNINNLEWTKAVLTACEELKSPVILGVSEGAGKYMTGFKTVAAMVDAMVDSMGITVPVALHLDHGTYEGCKACVEAGFSSIMFDGSHYSIEENVEKTKELVALAHSKGMSIEAEVGSIGGVEDGVVGNGEIADPAECAKITDLGIDFLAAGIGCLVYLLARREKFTFKAELPKYVGAACETVGQLFYIYALADEEHVMMSAPIISAYCVASVLWSRLFLKEKLSWKHYTCILVTFAGILIMGIYDM